MSKKQKLFAGVVGVVVLLAILIGGNLVSLQGKIGGSKTYKTIYGLGGVVLKDSCTITCPNAQPYTVEGKSCSEISVEDVTDICNAMTTGS